MGKRKCCIEGCLSTSNRKEDEGVTFHKFAAKLTDEWLKACRVDPEKKNSVAFVCSRHFRKSDFQDFKGNKYFLKQGAIPSIFPWTYKSRTSTANVSTPTASSSKPSSNEAESPTKMQVPSAGSEIGSPDGIQLDSKLLEPEISMEVKEIADSPKQEAVEKPLINSSQGKSDATPKSPLKKRRRTMKKETDTSSPEPSRKLSRRTLNKSLKQEESEEPQNQAKLEKPVKIEKTLKSEVSKVVAAAPTPTPTPTSSTALVTPKKKSQAITFLPGSVLEAKDFDGKWIQVRVMEVDTDDREVLVRSEKSAKSKGSSKHLTDPYCSMNDEWIPMDSSRLRTPEACTYELGEKCMARWSDCRKFPATIQKILENDAYDVLFDDGYVKTVRGQHITKIASKSNVKVTPGKLLADYIPSSLVPDYIKEMPIPEVPSDGEWCCAWIDEIPIGEDSMFEGPHSKIPSIVVKDPRIPEGWVKHIYLRQSGKWDILFINPTGKKCKNKHEVKAVVEEQGDVFDPEAFDFSLHKKRSKDLKIYITSDKLKQAGTLPNFEVNQEPLPDGTMPLMNPFASLGALQVLQPELTMTPVIGEVYVGSLKVVVIDKLFQCPQTDCSKTFRKENHLQIHIKHYHKELAKLMGVCPKMSDLAYVRTAGDEMNELPPTPTRVRKSGISPKLRIDVDVPKTPKTHKKEQKKRDKEIKREIKHELPLDIKYESQTPSPLKMSPILEEALKAPALTMLSPDIKLEKMDQNPVVMITPLTDKKRNLMVVPQNVDAESYLTTHAVPKQNMKLSKLKMNGPSKKKKIGFKMRAKNYKKRVFINRPRQVESADDGDTVIPRKTFPNRPSFASKNSFYANYGADSPATSNFSGYDYASSQSPNHIINEHGEVIKIVRMRKEEVINCLCGVVEEDGLMIQCELCLCWQHGYCNGIEMENQVPEKYVCNICKNPLRARQSQKYTHDQDWLYEGKLPIASFHLPNPKQTGRFDVLKQGHTLIGNLLEMKRFIRSMDVKINIAEKRGHPKMYLWSKKWESEDEKKVKVEDGEDVKVACSIPTAEEAIDPAKCQNILLDHIKKQQLAAMERLDSIDAQITDLEFKDDNKIVHTPETDTRTRQTMIMLMNDLQKLRKIASIHTTN